MSGVLASCSACTSSSGRHVRHLKNCGQHTYAEAKKRATKQKKDAIMSVMMKPMVMGGRVVVGERVGLSVGDISVAVTEDTPTDERSPLKPLNLACAANAVRKVPPLAVEACSVVWMELDDSDE